MSLRSQKTAAQPERIQVELESGLVKIRTERFDAKLGWYTAASLTLHPSQIGDLQQLLDQIRGLALKETRGQVIPFPRPDRQSEPVLARTCSGRD